MNRPQKQVFLGAVWQFLRLMIFPLLFLIILLASRSTTAYEIWIAALTMGGAALMLFLFRFSRFKPGRKLSRPGIRLLISLVAALVTLVLGLIISTGQFPGQEAVTWHDQDILRKASELAEDTMAEEERQGLDQGDVSIPWLLRISALEAGTNAEPARALNRKLILIGSTLLCFGLSLVQDPVSGLLTGVFLNVICLSGGLVLSVRGESVWVLTAAVTMCMLMMFEADELWQGKHDFLRMACLIAAGGAAAFLSFCGTAGLIFSFSFLIGLMTEKRLPPKGEKNDLPLLFRALDHGWKQTLVFGLAFAAFAWLFGFIFKYRLNAPVTLSFQRLWNTLIVPSEQTVPEYIGTRALRISNGLLAWTESGTNPSAVTGVLLMCLGTAGLGCVLPDRSNQAWLRGISMSCILLFAFETEMDAVVWLMLLLPLTAQGIRSLLKAIAWNQERERQEKKTMQAYEEWRRMANQLEKEREEIFEQERAKALHVPFNMGDAIREGHIRIIASEAVRVHAGDGVDESLSETADEIKENEGKEKRL